MPTEQPPDWMHALFDKIFRAYDQHDIDATASCYSEDLRVFINGEPGPQSREAFLQALHEQWTGFPDITVSERKRLVSGENVISEYVLDGHNSGPFLGRGPTGGHWRATLAWICVVREGRVSEIRAYVDNLGLVEALGRR